MLVGDLEHERFRSRTQRLRREGEGTHGENWTLTSRRPHEQHPVLVVERPPGTQGRRRDVPALRRSPEVPRRPSGFGVPHPVCTWCGTNGPTRSSVAEFAGKTNRAAGVRLSTKADLTLAEPGETCERVATASLAGLLAAAYRTGRSPRGPTAVAGGQTDGRQDRLGKLRRPPARRPMTSSRRSSSVHQQSAGGAGAVPMGWADATQTQAPTGMLTLRSRRRARSSMMPTNGSMRS